MQTIHKLMIKTHLKTNLKYLCYTTKVGKEYDEYLGSGTYWKRHLQKNGKDIRTELIFETSDYNEFRKYAIAKSLEYDVIKSKEWANLKLEEGYGGDTVSCRMWITNGEDNRYVMKTEMIPENWYRGRSKCVFNDNEKQREFSLRSGGKNKSQAIKEAWKNREKNGFGQRHIEFQRGDNHSSKRFDVRAKIGLKNSKPICVKGIHFVSIKAACEFFGAKRHVIDRWIKNGI